MAGEAVLAIDVGSTAVRAAVIDPSGSVRASARRERPDSLSGVTFDARLLWDQVMDAVGSLPEDERASIAGLAIAGHIGTVFTDAAVEPIGPGFGWADSAGVDLVAEALGAALGDALRTIGRTTVTGGPAAAAG